MPPVLFASMLLVSTMQPCGADRAISTLVGAGLGGAVAAIPATIVHRHDQSTSHRMVAVAVSGGAILGFIAANHDRPCIGRSDSAMSTAGRTVVVSRSQHSLRGAIIGASVGSVVGAIGGQLYDVGCDNDPCHPGRARVGITLFSAAEGAAALGLLGGLIGWAWPIHR